MSVIQRIQSTKNELSTTDKKIYQFITENIEEIPLMTSSKLAELSSTSPAAVIRFSKKLGYAKFVDFKLALSKDIENHISNEYSELSINDSFTLTKQKLAQNNTMMIEETMDLLDEETMERVITTIYNAKKIYVFAVGSSALAAEHIRQKWSRLGKTVIFEKDQYLLEEQLASPKEDYIFWGISHSGKNRVLLHLIDVANAHESTTIGMSQLTQNELTKKAAIHIQTTSTSNINNGHEGSGATHSILIQNLVVDAVFYFYMKKYILQTP